MKISFVEEFEIDETGITKYRISIDDKVDDKSQIVNDILYINNEETLEQLGELKLFQLTKYFNQIDFSLEQSVTEWSAFVSLYLKVKQNTFEEDKGYKAFDTIIECIVDSKEWNKWYSINLLEEIYEKNIKTISSLTYVPDVWDYANGIGKILYKSEKNKKLKDVIKEIRHNYELVGKKVLDEISSLFLPDMLTTQFEFPENLKVACKQYLVYFAQFLSDLGINANTSIKEEANKVLFTVIPEDGNTALDKIKEALEVYINAPGIKNFDIILNDKSPNNIAVLQWEANIHHLKGQLSLQQATLQAKDATIEALQLSNYRLKEELSELNQIENKTDNNEEKIAGGVVTVKKYDGKFFSIDIPAIIRRLKRK